MPTAQEVAMQKRAQLQQAKQIFKTNRMNMQRDAQNLRQQSMSLQPGQGVIGMIQEKVQQVRQTAMPGSQAVAAPASQTGILPMFQQRMQSLRQSYPATSAMGVQPPVTPGIALAGGGGGGGGGLGRMGVQTPGTPGIALNI